MFSATPPATSRVRRTGAAGRRQTILRDSELPYISPQANFSYGSRVANLPKAPRLSETKVRLADALQAKTDAVEARLRDEQEAREREAANRRGGSMAPPSRATSRAPSRGPSVVRDQSAAVTRDSRGSSEANELSTLSNGMDISRSFGGAYSLDPAISGKVTENTLDLDQDMGGQDNGGDGGLFHLDSQGGDSGDSASEGVAFGKPLAKPLQPSTRSNGSTLRGRTESGAVRHRQSPRQYSPDENQQQQRSKSRTRREGNKENDVRTRGQSKSKSAAGQGTSRRSARSQPPPEDDPPPPGDGAPSSARKRRTSREDPRFSDSPLDWFFRQWHEWLGARVAVFGYFLLMLGLLLVSSEAIKFWQGEHGLFSHIVDHSSSYKPPSTPPKDITALADRVFKFEEALGTVDYRFAKRISKETKNLRSSIEQISKQITSATGSSSADTVVLQTRLSELTKRIEEADKKAKQYQTILGDQTSILSDLTTRLNPESLRYEIRKQVREGIPKQLAAVFGEDGRVHFPPEFERVLEDLFDNWFPQKVNKFVKGEKIDPVKTLPSWDNFLQLNEGRLRSVIVKEVDDGIMEHTKRLHKDDMDGSTEVRLSKDTVMVMIEDKINKFVSNIERDYIDQKFEKFEKKNAASMARVEARINALGKFTRNNINRATEPVEKLPDYANRLAGGLVWPYLTSPTYTTKEASAAVGILHWLFPRYKGTGPHPAIAILPSADTGDCWPFPGNTGTLAIKLSEHIHPSSVTIEHGHKSTLSDVSSAPKKFEFWVRITNTTERAKVERAARHAAKISGSDTSRATMKSRRILGDQPGPASYDQFVKIMEFTYDIDRDVGQTFELPVDFTNLGVTTNVVAFKVSENYGNKDFTCLYRAKVHGFPLFGSAKGAPEGRFSKGRGKKQGR